MRKKKETLTDVIAPMDDEIYRGIVEDQINLICRRDMSGRITFANRAFCSFLAKDVYEVVGKSLVLPMAAGEAERLQSLRAAISAANPSIVGEFRMKGPGGDERWVLWTERGIYDDKGELVAYQSVAQDITQGKLADDMRRRYEFIVNTSQEFMTFVNRDYRYEAVNDAYCRAHGMTREDILGRTVAEVWGEVVFREKLERHFEVCYSGKDVQFEAEFVFGTLGLKYMRISFYPYFDSTGDVTHVIVITHDISDKVKAERELQSSYVSLEQRVGERTAALSEMNMILTKEVYLREEAEKEVQEVRVQQDRLIKEQKELITRLEEALEEVKTLSGILPICSHCKKIRDDEGYWKRVEDYIESHSSAQLSHGVCPDCLKKFYPDLAERILKDMEK